MRNVRCVWEGLEWDWWWMLTLVALLRKMYCICQKWNFILNLKKTILCKGVYQVRKVEIRYRMWILNNVICPQVTIYQCEAKGVIKLLQAYMDADVSFSSKFENSYLPSALQSIQDKLYFQFCQRRLASLIWLIIIYWMKSVSF